MVIQLPVVHHRLTVARFAAGGLLSIGASFAPLATAAPMTMAFYCTAHFQQAKTLYMSPIFTASAEKRDVISAWKLHLESQGVAVGAAASCDAAVDAAGVKPLMDVSRASAGNISMRVVDVDWKFANQVPISEPNMLYGYCQSGTSVADVAYFSDVFGVPTVSALQRVDVTTPFIQYVRTTYGDPPGLAMGRGPGPRGEWCTLIGNIADAERDKKAAQDKLRSATRQIIETAWRYGATPTSSTSGPSAAAASTSPAPPVQNASAQSAPAANATGQAYFCMAYSANHQYTYFTRVQLIEADWNDIAAAWRQWVTPANTPGVVETQGSAVCPRAPTLEAASYNRSLLKEAAERNAASNPAAGWRVIELDWKFTPS